MHTLKSRRSGCGHGVAGGLTHNRTAPLTTQKSNDAGLTRLNACPDLLAKANETRRNSPVSSVKLQAELVIALGRFILGFTGSHPDLLHGESEENDDCRFPTAQRSDSEPSPADPETAEQTLFTTSRVKKWERSGRLCSEEATGSFSSLRNDSTRLATHLTVPKPQPAQITLLWK
ncbi:hypothetical protein SRHO_G00000540 [Serrasalmus rhombeus]